MIFLQTLDIFPKVLGTLHCITYSALFMATDFEIGKSAFKKHYDSNLSRVQRAEQAFKNLIQNLLSDYALESVSSRIKSYEGCIEKFERKYRAKLENDNADYIIGEHITDLIGIRIVCLYESDVRRIGETIKQNFENKGITDKIAEIENTENQFGYKGLHFDLKLNSTRSSLPEYQEILEFRFELQIRTVIQDAWSQLDHKLKYKKSIPPYLKRKINCLAALFELADREFLQVKNDTEQYENHVKSINLTQQAEVCAENKDTQVDLLSLEYSQVEALDVFQFFNSVAAYFPIYSFSPEKSDSFVQEILTCKPSFSLGELESSLSEHFEKLERYKVHLEKQNQRLTPFTMLRHILFLKDKTKFEKILFPSQKHSFEEWLNTSVQEANPSRQVLL